MILPNIEEAVVAEAKIVDDLLNAAHPDGASKAAFFAALGFSADHWTVLAEAFRRLAATTAVARTVESVHGTKYIIEGQLAGPSGRIAAVRTVWIVDTGRTAPRLVTAYPLDLGDES
jgi:hypothetical protein